MTGRLHLRYEKWLDGDVLDQGVVANIYAVGKTAGRASQSSDRRGVLIPAGEGGRLAVQLDPGRYLVECPLPSGEIVSGEAEVVQDGDVELDLRSEHSPHEWLSWQQFLGNVEAIGSYEARPAPARLFEPTVYGLDDVVPELWAGPPAGAGAWRLLDGLDGLPADVIAQRLSTHAPVSPSGPAMWDEQMQLYEIVAPDPFPGPHGPAPTRRYVVVESEQRVEVASLPEPWVDVTTYEPVKVQVLVRRQSGDGRAVSVTVRDRRVGSALGYMTAGALPAALRIFDEAMDLLYRKLRNPLAAAAGGYVLLGTEQGSDSKPWHPWIANLCNWFTWLPDGAILQAWLTLRHRRSEEDVQAAKESLRKAYVRGLPYYSAGLPLLADGLRLFAEDREFAAMEKQVRRVGWRADLQEPFTVLQFAGP